MNFKINFSKPSTSSLKKPAPSSPTLKPKAKDDTELPKPLEIDNSTNPGYSSLRLSANTVGKNLRKLTIKEAGGSEEVSGGSTTPPSGMVFVGHGSMTEKKSPPISSIQPSHQSLPTSTKFKPSPSNSANGSSPNLSSSNGSISKQPIGNPQASGSILIKKVQPAELSSSAGELPSFNQGSMGINRNRPVQSSSSVGSSPVSSPINTPISKPPIPTKSYFNPSTTNSPVSSPSNSFGSTQKSNISTSSTSSLSSSSSSSSPSLQSSNSMSPLTISPILSSSPSTFSNSISSNSSLEKPIARKPALPPRNELKAEKGTMTLPKLKPTVSNNAQKYLNTMIQNSGVEENDNSSDEEENTKTLSNNKFKTLPNSNNNKTTTTNNGNNINKAITTTTTTSSNNNNKTQNKTTKSNRPLPTPKEITNASSSPANSSTALSKPKDKKESDSIQRNYLVQEILSTERKYVNSLSRIITIFMLPLKDKSETKEKILSLEDINNIFSNIETIFLLHKTFLVDLEARISQWSDTQKIGDVFVNFAPYLKSYVFYSNAYNNTMVTIGNLQKSNPAFQSFLQKCLQKPSSKGLNISAYLIMPIQRIPRYRLLLEQIIKYSEESHVDYKDLILALGEISKVASQVDERILQYQISHKVLDIQNSLNGLTESIVTPTRIFKKEGDLKKISDRVVNTRHFFLFNDLLIYSKKERKNTYQFKYSFPLSTCWVKDIPDSPRFTNLFQIVSSKKNYFLSAPSLEDKLSWMQMLNEVINKVVQDNPDCQTQRESIYGKRGSTTTKEILSDLEKSGEGESEAELRNQPLWLKDQMTKDCMLCKSNFTITKRRHHCRKCFKIFCNSCCPVYDFSQYLQGKKIRLCKTCNEEVAVQLSVMSQNEEPEPTIIPNGGTENNIDE